MTLTEAQAQFNDLADRLSAAKAAQKAALAAFGRNPTDVWDTYPDELRAVTGGTGNYQESKTVTADPAGMTITPDEGYSGMLKAIIAAEPNFQSYNLVEGIEAWGITGTAKPAVSTAPPTNLPVDKDDADAALVENDATADTSTFDLMVLAQDDGNITYCYLDKGTGKVSYNGVELPALPEWDKATYPCAYICKIGDDYVDSVGYEYQFYILSNACQNVDGSITSGEIKTKFGLYSCSADDSSFTFARTSQSVNFIMADGKVASVIWTNTDILNSDGTVYLAASDPVPSGAFTITSYDPITTEFKAKGWRRLSYHTTGEQAGTWTYDDFTDTESGGWNYLKNIRSCSREKLYYTIDGTAYEVWPNSAWDAADNWSYNGTVLPKLPQWDRETYPYAYIDYSVGTYYLHFCASEMVIKDNAMYSKSGELVETKYSKIDKYGVQVWSELIDSEIGLSGIVAPFWCNCDLYYTDGDIYLAGSDPVPVEVS